MQQIPCPYCGARAEMEFTCGGEAHIVRPEDPAAVDDAAWADYLHMRANPKGVSFERWCHTYGCGQWFHVVRDTRTHAILGVYGVQEPRPPLKEGQP